MNLRRRNKNKISKKIIFLLLSLITLFGINFFTNGFFTSNLSYLIPTFSNRFNVSNLNFFAGVENFNSNSIKKENEELKSELNDLRVLRYENAFLKEENKSLRNLFATSSISSRAIIADVYSTFGVFPYGTILISTNGTNINEGDIVMANNAVAIGVVSKKNSDNTALVTLFSSNGYKLKVILKSDDEEPTFLEALGVGHASFVIKVPRDLQINKGDFVYSPESFGRIVAEVYDIEEKPEDAFKTVFARVPQNIETLELVSVLQK